MPVTNLALVISIFMFLAAAAEQAGFGRFPPATLYVCFALTNTAAWWIGRAGV